MAAPRLADGLTLKMARFAAEVVNNGGNATKAYRHAYDTHTDNDQTVWRNASALLSDDKVAARIQELEAAEALAAGESTGSVLAHLIELSHDAAKNGQYGPAVRATELRGKAIGMFRDSIDVRGGLTLTPGPAASLSIEELRALIDDQPADEKAQLPAGSGDGISSSSVTEP